MTYPMIDQIPNTALILRWKPVAQEILSTVSQYFSHYFGCYLGIVLLGDNPGSQTYVAMKKKQGHTVWISCHVAESLTNTEEVLSQIHERNTDDLCVGILVQLPLPSWYDYGTIMQAIDPKKDCDWLGGVVLGQSLVGMSPIDPATPDAALSLLDAYDLGDMQGKVCTILGQSNLIGKPLTAMIQARWGTVVSCNIDTPSSFVHQACQTSDYIFSATGVHWLINQRMVRHDQSQVIVDIGRGMRDGKAHGDCLTEELIPLVHAITPVPWWVWPMTIACLFRNIMRLHQA